MQEEVEHKVVALIIDSAKLTERELQNALSKLITHIKAQQQLKEPPHGKQTVKQLAAQNKGMQSIEVSDANISSFNRIASKYGIDFAPYKIKGENRYLVFFKALDADAMTAAFREYTAKQLTNVKRPSVLEKLEQFRELIAKAIPHRTKDRDLAR